ncbi:DcrB-related protein [Mixta intestinalis]|uniref:DUF1795 domain-containing protein n=1 Tax=Mixta intestinalis TaxID=1615494 RepID=A0A6P1PU89_9GAMM|nr:DUF1795 domain-containing protein [Mixta intestinalis]QHM70036.1 hypothetical protein C7M51_00296 [Mixta intestinalis]
MSAYPPVSLLSEGVVTIPEGCQDRTVNIFTQPDADAPSFNIARDTLHPNESLTAYIDRQLALMKKHIKGWKQEARSAAVLGDNLSQGEIVQVSYLREGKRIQQQQAVFNPTDDNVLVFTMTSAQVLSEADNARFRAFFGSFRFHSAG